MGEMMKTTPIHRTNVTSALTVSTVLVVDGGRWYETTIILHGRVGDPRKTYSKSDAGYEHDAAVEWALYPHRRDPASARGAHWALVHEKLLRDLQGPVDGNLITVPFPDFHRGVGT